MLTPRLFTLTLVALVALPITLPSVAARADEAPAPAPATVTPAPVEATPAPADELPRPSLGLCIGFGAGGIASLVAGIAVGAVAKSYSNDQNGSVAHPPLYTPHLQKESRQGEGLADGAYALIGVGAAFLVTDVILWIERTRKHPKPVETTAVSFNAGNNSGKSSAQKPVVSASPAGLQVSF